MGIAMLQVARQPNCRSCSEPQLADYLIAVLENLAEADGIVTRRNIAWEEFFFQFLLQGDLPERGGGEYKRLPRPAEPRKTPEDGRHVRGLRKAMKWDRVMCN
jgi:hypothetical protein